MAEHGSDDRGRDPRAHSHAALSHDHAHYHVTHNFNALTGGFDHLFTQHSHPHDHAAVEHSHHPHENFDAEHGGEAHEHGASVSGDGKGNARAATKAAGTKAGAPKAPGTKAAGAKAAASKQQSSAVGDALKRAAEERAPGRA